MPLKLSTVPSRLAAPPRRIGPADATPQAQDQYRAATRPWRGWYKLARWRDMRMRVFVRDLFTCQCGCGKIEGDTSKLVADHKRPHRGDPDLFWDEANVQTLTKACHDGAKQAQEQREARGF